MSHAFFQGAFQTGIVSTHPFPGLSSLAKAGPRSGQTLHTFKRLKAIRLSVSQPNRQMSETCGATLSILKACGGTVGLGYVNDVKCLISFSLSLSLPLSIYIYTHTHFGASLCSGLCARYNTGRVSRVISGALGDMYTVYTYFLFPIPECVARGSRL